MTKDFLGIIIKTHTAKKEEFMVKGNFKYFRIIAFIIKLALILLSITAFLFVCFVSEQTGAVIQLQTIPQKGEVNMLNLNLGINDKVLSRLFLGVTKLCTITTKVIMSISALSILLYASVWLTHCVFVVFSKKFIKAEKHVYKEQNFIKLAKLDVCANYDIIENLNLTLTI